MAVDFETALTTGEASVEFFREDFRVISAAFTYRASDGILTSEFLEGELPIAYLLSKLSDLKCPIIVHNYGFEIGCCLHRFPQIELNWHADTMRLAQVADAGGKQNRSEDELTLDEELEQTTKSTGYSLESCASRFTALEFHNHKAQYYQYLRETHQIRAGKEGANLHLLPAQLLREYNIRDTEVTLALYEAQVAFLGNYDWSFDHQFYMGITRLITQSRARGVKVDQEALNSSLVTITSDIQSLKDTFITTFSKEIAQIEEAKKTAFIEARKSPRGQESARKTLESNPDLYQFNVNSVKDKKVLFIDKLKIEPVFFTDAGAPSFARQFLNQWGKGGLLLKTRGTAGIVQAQMTSLKELSARDGRWHIDLKAVGTATGRNAGAGGLNVQGLSRRNKLLMSSIVADPGYSFVSIDLSAGEPTVTTHFSKDPMYKAATFDMAGKEPYYQGNVLMIDDIYLMGMSVSPMGKHKLRDAFYTGTYEGMSFSEAWVKDADLVKKQLSEDRAFHKILILGLGYAMGPKHMVESAHKAGFQLTLKEAKGFFKEYWDLFKDVRALSDNLTSIFNKYGSLTNPFGYRLLPDPDYKALNYFIQSTVSGIINALCIKFFDACPYAHFVTVIHDEVILQVPQEKLAEAKVLWENAVTELNGELNWSVKIRTGWKEGKDFYEAK